MKLPASSLQRWSLYQVTNTIEYQGQDARRYRRLCAHMGLTVIYEAALVGARVEQIRSTELRLFEVESDDLELLVKIDDTIKRSGDIDAILGPLFDAVLEMRAGRSPAGIANLNDYDASLEQWKPTPVLDQGGTK